jgi:nucleotide-binding universal stress UspA family protein
MHPIRFTTMHFSEVAMSVTYTSRRPVRPTSLLDLPPPVHTEQQGGTRRRLRRILAATDGTPASEGALRLSGLLAERDGAIVEVLSVLERWGDPAPVHEFVDIAGELMAHRVSRVIPQAESAFGDWKGWTVRLTDGSNPSTIGELAEAEGYDLIVVGLRRRWASRLLRPTALRVAHHSRVPVLAVPPSVTALPTRALLGIDTSEAALSAARTAARLLGESATVHLVHVWTPGAPHDVGYAPLFESFERELHGSELAHIKRRVLRGGEPAERLLAYAGRVQADLIAVGSHRPTSLAHRLLGGVSWRILRAAHCCVLLAGHDTRQPLSGITGIKGAKHRLGRMDQRSPQDFAPTSSATARSASSVAGAAPQRQSLSQSQANRQSNGADDGD